jgi:hypothetical protein
MLLALGTLITKAQERTYSVTTFGAFTTSSKLFHHPDATNEITRGQYLPLDDILSMGVEIRKNISSIRAQLGLSIEYLSKSEVINVPTSSSSIPLSDGFTVFPIELTGYFVIPFSGESVQLFMGGGAGLYPGFRAYDYAGASAIVADRTTGAGIHVVSGVEYRLNDLFSLRSMIKFRDVQFESVNRFARTSVVYNGAVVNLTQEPLSSRVNIDGMVATLGVVVYF